MRMHFRWMLIVAGLLMAPSALFAQQGSYTQEVPPVIFTGFLSHPRYEDGGFFVGAEFLYGKTNRQLAAQNVAYRGFRDIDGSISGTPNSFIGSGNPALNTNQVAGTGNFQPGFDLYLGWRFQGGVAVELSWKHYKESNYQAQASIIPPNYRPGTALENTFLFAPVTNFSTDFAGNDVNVQNGTVGSTFGIWNAASFMQITLTQQIDIYQIRVRIPMWDTDSYRNYGLIGPRIVTLQDKFAWFTVDTDTIGNFTPDTTARFTNTVTNNMYGVHFGFGHDWYLGNTPIGGFSFNFEAEAALYANLVKASANWDRGDDNANVGRVRNLSTLVPGVEARIGVTWWAWEGITVHLGYDVTTFFNTIASRHPIDFNMGSNNPQFDPVLFRWVHGLNFGVTLVF